MSIKIISHRGLLNGPDADLENNPDQILTAAELGYDVEIDLRINGNKIFLGHDYEQYEIDSTFLYNNKFWIHAKNAEALQWLHTTNLKYFWHQEDDYTLTSNNFIWVYPGKKLFRHSICVLPESADYSVEDLKLCYAICTDYPEKYNNLVNT